jgi:hypothetical protein
LLLGDNMPLTKKGKEIMGNMRKEYGAKKAKEVFYASKNAGKISGIDRGFYNHLTHASLQSQEESVECIGMGFNDSSVPKKPLTDKFYPKAYSK